MMRATGGHAAGGGSRIALIGRLLLGSAPVLAVLIAGSFVSGVPPELRNAGLAGFGLAGILLAERALFGPDIRRGVRALGLTRPRGRGVAVALAASLPMWAFLPLVRLAEGGPTGVAAGWPGILASVVLLNGLTEEVIHRAFVFGHLRRAFTFGVAMLLSSLYFAIQHLYLVGTLGAAGAASVLLAFLIGMPLCFLYERGGCSVAAPAILHTSANAPFLIFAGEGAPGLLLAHMAVVLVSMYAVFGARQWLR